MVQAYVLIQTDTGRAADVARTIRDLDGAANDGSVALLSLDTLEYRPLIERAYNARYTPTGHIVFMREDAIWAVPFDLERVEVSGTPVTVVDGIITNPLNGSAFYDIADDGTLPQTAIDAVKDDHDHTQSAAAARANGITYEAIWPGQVRCSPRVRSRIDL